MVVFINPFFFLLFCIYMCSCFSFVRYFSTEFLTSFFHFIIVHIAAISGNSIFWSFVQSNFAKITSSRYTHHHFNECVGNLYSTPEKQALARMCVCVWSSPTSKYDMDTRFFPYRRSRKYCYLS